MAAEMGAMGVVASSTTAGLMPAGHQAEVPALTGTNGMAEGLGVRTKVGNSFVPHIRFLQDNMPHVCCCKASPARLHGCKGLLQLPEIMVAGCSHVAVALHMTCSY